MPLFRRTPIRPPVRMPRIDRFTRARSTHAELCSFIALTLYAIGYREALDPEAAVIASKQRAQSTCAIGGPPATTVEAKAI